MRSQLDFNPGDQVESMNNVTWSFDDHLDPPSDLYKHADGTEPHEELRVDPGHVHLFEKPLTSFRAMLPIDFWQNVLIQTNATAQATVSGNNIGFLARRKWTGPFSLNELMKFLGCIVIIGLGKCGSYEKYWQGNGSMRVFMPRMYFNHLCFTNRYMYRSVW